MAHWNAQRAAEKKKIVARILDNPVYQPDSALVKRLELLLTSRLGLDDLRNLETVINLKKKEG